MCGSMADIQSAAAEIRRGKKEERRRRTNNSIKIQWSALFHGATITTVKMFSKRKPHEIDTDLQTHPSEESNTSSMWICRTSVQRFPRYPPITPFLSLVTLAFDLYLHTRPSGDVSYTKSHRQRQKQNLTQFTVCGKIYTGMTTSPLWGYAPIWALKSYVCVCGGIHDIITGNKNFIKIRFGGFWATRVQKAGSPIDLTYRPYNSPCSTTVMLTVTKASE